MFKRRFFCFLLCLVMLLPISACSNTMDAYIYFELPAVPETLDPQTASKDQELLIIRNIFEGLLRKDKNGKIVCGVADNYKKEGLTYTFKIRKNALWSNGEEVTANDFVFAFRRAVLPETNAPFVSRLFSIVGAESIYKDNSPTDILGVFAENDKTLKINLSYEDPLFEETLTTSIAMPCNEKFFKESTGKYGLFSNNILSNSSYKITKWKKDPLGIRLYRNDEYKGNFTAQNAAVFITCEQKKSALEKLQKTTVDMAFINSTESITAKESGLKTAEFENICWVLTLGDNFSKNMCSSLLQMIDRNIYSKSLKTGYSSADSIFPNVVKNKSECILENSYNPENAKKIYNNEILSLPDRKFPTDIILYYYDDGNVKDVVTDIVGHWQSNFSAFVNIESVSESKLLFPQLTNQSYAMSFFPIRVDSNSISEYLNKYGFEYNNQSLSQAQNDILKSNNIMPIMFQNTVIAYSETLSGVYAEHANGYIDFSFIIKND